MKKLLFSIFILFFGFNIFAFNLDLMGNISYEYITYKGKTSLNTNGQTVPFSSSFNCGGVVFGADICFTDKFGIYSRVGLLTVGGVNRSVNNTTYDLKLSNSSAYGNTVDLGVTFAFPLNNYFSVWIAPAFTMNYCEYNYYKFNLYNPRAIIESNLGFGALADVYLKFRYGHFVASVGCAGSALFSSMVTSSDTSIDYSYNIRDTVGFAVRPYIAAGVTF